MPTPLSVFTGANMLIKKTSLVCLTIMILLAVSTSALACACCAERGTYSVWTGVAKSFQTDILKDMKFGDAAELYITEAGFETIRGIGVVEKDFESMSDSTFNLGETYANNTWRLTFKTPTGRIGSLVLPRPSRMTMRNIHIPDNVSTAPSVTLHKEMIFNGRVGSGTGFFKTSVASSPKYSLVFIGRGNVCDNAEDFKNWRLDIDGPKTEYAFFGKMKAAG